MSSIKSRNIYGNQSQSKMNEIRSLKTSTVLKKPELSVKNVVAITEQDKYKRDCSWALFQIVNWLIKLNIKFDLANSIHNDFVKTIVHYEYNGGYWEIRTGYQDAKTNFAKAVLINENATNYSETYTETIFLPNATESDFIRLLFPDRRSEMGIESTPVRKTFSYANATKS